MLNTKWLIFNSPLSYSFRLKIIRTEKKQKEITATHTNNTPPLYTIQPTTFDISLENEWLQPYTYNRRQVALSLSAGQCSWICHLVVFFLYCEQPCSTFVMVSPIYVVGSILIAIPSLAFSTFRYSISAGRKYANE